MEPCIYNLGGTLRSQSAEKTLAWLMPLLPEIGITRVAPVTNMDHIGIPTAISIRPNAKHLSVSQGKGVNITLAKISAIMESIEGYHAENPPPVEFCGTYHELKNQHPVIDPHLFPRTLFTKKDLGHYPFAWAKAYDLCKKTTCYLPHALTCLDSTELRPEYGYLDVNSSGLAAGNLYEEALCHGLYELIERDALYRFQTLPPSKQFKNQIDLTTVPQGTNREIINKFQQAGLSVRAFEITSSLGIPAFHCAVFDPNIMRKLGVFTGAGAHLSTEIALSRALTEAAQTRLTLITGSRDDIFPHHYYQDTPSHAHLIEQSAQTGRKNYQDCCHPFFTGTFNNHIEHILTALKHTQLFSVFQIDHTKPKFNIPVIQVFVPGLLFNGARI